MNWNRIAGIAMGIMLAAFATPLLAQDVNSVAAVPDRYMPVALHAKGKQDSPRVTLERNLAEGNALLDQGKHADALERFIWAMTYATELESDADLTYAMYRTGLVHERIYERTGDVMNLKAAIAYWEHERTLYTWHAYPEEFRAHAGFKLGQAYLALSRHEDLVGNAQLGLAILEDAVKTYGDVVALYEGAMLPVAKAEAVK